MPKAYITYFVARPQKTDTNFADFWENFDKLTAELSNVDQTNAEHYTRTRTITKNIADLTLDRDLVPPPIVPPTDMSYVQFMIPKHSGGYRTISAPNPALKSAQTQALQHMNKVSTAMHNAAFAYVKQRSCKDALTVHQENGSNWFMKIDLKNFFPSCNSEFVKTQLKKVFPYCLATENELSWLYDICFLDDALPQGAPTSPMLTNLIMIPLDHEINKQLFNYDKHRFVYTRYADDILISCKETFNVKEITGVLEEIFKDTPLKINKDKTRYGSKAGHNWNLGLVLNKDDNITTGFRRKRYLKNSWHNFKRDYGYLYPIETGVQPPVPKFWALHDLQVLMGEAAYIHQIEPDAVPFFDILITQINRHIKAGHYFSA